MKIYTKKIEADPGEKEETPEETSFLYLTCDLPPTPLFKNELMENIIPQVSLLVSLCIQIGVLVTFLHC